MSEESNDVTRALAAFGAPAIRYHSFGQSHVKPSSLALPRRAVEATLPTLPMVEPGTPVIRQNEPTAAPEAPVPRAMLPEASVPHRASPLFPSTPSVAPPARPLAEWAAPVSTAPLRPVMAPPVPPSLVAPEPGYTVVIPTPTANPLPRPAPASMPSTSLTVPDYIPTPPPDSIVTSRVEIPNRSSSLPEIFEFLAAS